MAYAPGIRALISADYLVELDDDVVGAPLHWDTTMRDALQRLPTIGFLAADLKTIHTTSRRTIGMASVLTSTSRTSSTAFACSAGRQAAPAP